MKYDNLLKLLNKHKREYKLHQNREAMNGSDSPYCRGAIDYIDKLKKALQKIEHREKKREIKEQELHREF